MLFRESETVELKLVRTERKSTKHPFVIASGICHRMK